MVEFFNDLTQTGFYARRVLADGRILAVFPILFGRARLGIGDGTGFSNLW